MKTLLILTTLATVVVSQEDPLASTGIIVHDKLDSKATAVVSSTDDIKPVPAQKTVEPTYVENVPFEVAVAAAEKKFDVFQSAQDVRTKKLKNEIKSLKASIQDEIQKHTSDDEDLRSTISTEEDVVDQLTKAMEGLKSKYESAISTVNALTETVDDEEQALKTQKDKYRSLRKRSERKEGKIQQALTTANEKLEMKEAKLSSARSNLKEAREKNKMLKEMMESQKIEFRTKAEEAEGLIESYKKERDETVHSLEVSNAKLRNMIDHSHLAASAFAKLVNERAYYKNLSEKEVKEETEEAGAESSGAEAASESAGAEVAEESGGEAGSESAGTEAGSEARRF